MLERRGKGEAELEALFVEPDAIGRGYGKKLMQHARKTALAMGCNTVIIQGDPHAEPFYASIGARRIGTRPSASIAGRELPLFRLDLK
jgi:GNAT superfamily N-acetyltransferase